MRSMIGKMKIKIKIKIPVYTACIVGVLLIQSTILNYIRIYDIKPNLIIVFTVSAAFLNGSVEGAIVGFFTGLAQDIISGKVIGFYALLGLYLGLAVGSINKRLYRENIFVVIFFTFISTIAYESAVFFLWFFGSIIRGQVNLLYPFKEIILPEAVYNSAISVFVHIFMIKLSKAIENVKSKENKY